MPIIGPGSMAKRAGLFQAVIGEMRRYMLGLGIPVESSQTERRPRPDGDKRFPF